MQQDLGLYSQNVLSSNLVEGIAAGKDLGLWNSDFLILGCDEEGGNCLQREGVLLELGGEGHSVVNAEGEEDGFHLEAVSNAETKH